jgi:acyl carrier protein
MQGIEQIIRSFIVENFLFGDEGRAPAVDDSFLELGIIDSTGVLELVAFLEQSFGFKVKDAELLPDNLDTINAVAAYIRRKNADA